MPAKNLIASLCCVVAATFNMHCVTTSPPPTTVPPATRVTLHTASQVVTFEVEIADDDIARERGLMFRKSMAADRGMLFIFPDEVVRSFWMKNTYLPLDIIFISAGRQVVGVIDHAEPLNMTPRSVAAASRYVLEINAGLAKRLGVGADTAVTFVGLPLASP